MKKVFVISYCLIVSMLGHSQYLMWNDLLTEGSNSKSTISHSLTNAKGFIFCGGTFSGSMDFNPNPNVSVTFSTTSAAVSNLFFATYGAGGDYVSAFHLQSKANMSFGGMVADVSGNKFISGSFKDTADLNPAGGQALYVPLVSNAEDVFIVKYNSQTIFQWARQLVSTNFTRVMDMKQDGSGNLLLTGVFKGNTDFDPGAAVQNLTSSGEDIFIARYSSGGNYLNAVKIGAPSMTGVQQVRKLETDQFNNIYITGLFEGSVDFDPSATSNILTATGANDFYLAKYNSSLQLVWVYQFGSPKDEGSIDLKIRDNELYLAGSFKDSIDLNLKSGLATHVSNGQFDAFFARYNLSANYILSKSFGSSGKDEIISMDVFNPDSLFITGHFQGTVDFNPSSGSNSLTSSAFKSLFFGSYNATGDLNQISKVTGSGDVVSALIRNDGSGNPLLLGNLKGTANFDGLSPFVQNFTGPASFIARYGRCGKAEITTSSVNASCGNTDGSASATVTGGSAPLRYVWSSGDLKSSADSLRAGLYYLTVIDTLNCVYYSDPVLVNEAGGPALSLVNKTDVTCPGGNDGAIVLGVSGGKTPYTFRWSNGSSSQNISALKSGDYEVVVTDDALCKSHLRVNIGQADALTVYPVISEPSCGLSNGSVTAVVTGGNAPYSYTWLPSGSGSTLTGISSGIYTAVIKDANNCTTSEIIVVNDDKAADIYLDSLFEISCGIGDGAIYISVFGGVPTYTYSWNTGSFTSQDVTGLTPGLYNLKVSDAVGCNAFFSRDLNALRPVRPDVCIVDVDSLSGNSTVVWEKPSNRGALDYYSIYRETTTLNVFDLIQSPVDFSDLSLFEDQFANTWTRPWSYKISVTDTCGIESELSDFHTTIHAVITKNAQQEFNVLWTPYRGNFPVSQYTCYRYTDSTGTVDSLTTVPSNIFTFTDLTSPSKGSDVYYFVQVNHPDGCTATDAQNRNSSRSNRGSMAPPNYKTTVPEFKNQRNKLNFFPNPAGYFFSFEFDAEEAFLAEVILIGLQGNVVQTSHLNIQNGSSIYNVNLTDIKDGLYMVQIRLNREVYTGKLMVRNN